MADVKKDEPIVKKYSFTKEEKDKIVNCQNVIGILMLEREGLYNSIYLEMSKAKQRLGLDKIPEGFTRSVNMDPAKYELIVTDIKVPENPEKVVNEAKNGETSKN